MPADRRRGGLGSTTLTVLERALRGRDDVFFKLLIDGGKNAATSAVLLAELLHGYPDTEALALQIKDLEHVGDQITHDITDRVNKAVATPIERDDILALASAIDDVVDFIDEAAAYLALYRVEASMVQADAMARVLVEATRELSLALGKFEDFEDITEHIVEIHRLENEGDQLVRNAIASLFTDRIDPLVVLRWKDIFERIEDSIDATERVAFVLEGAFIKNI